VTHLGHQLTLLAHEELLKLGIDPWAARYYRCLECGIVVYIDDAYLIQHPRHYQISSCMKGSGFMSGRYLNMTCKDCIVHSVIV